MALHAPRAPKLSLVALVPAARALISTPRLATSTFATSGGQSIEAGSFALRQLREGWNSRLVLPALRHQAKRLKLRGVCANEFRERSVSMGNFLIHRVNWLLGMDIQQQKAASRLVLRAGCLQR